MTIRDRVQQLCDADKRGLTPHTRYDSHSITIQEAIDAEIDYKLNALGEGLMKFMRGENHDHTNWL